MKTKPRAPRKSREFWIDLVTTFERLDGVTREEFAKEHEVNFKTFENWIYKLRNERTTKNIDMPVRFVEVTSESYRPPQSSGAMLETNAFRLHFETLPQPGWLADLMRQTMGNKSC
jgi:hypothetical protein